MEAAATDMHQADPWDVALIRQKSLQKKHKTY